MCIKKLKKFAKLGNVEIEKQKFHQHKRSVYFNKQYIDINKIVVSSTVSFSKRRF